MLSIHVVIYFRSIAIVQIETNSNQVNIVAMAAPDVAFLVATDVSSSRSNAFSLRQNGRIWIEYISKEVIST